jgi:hypothetical protein
VSRKSPPLPLPFETPKNFNTITIEGLYILVQNYPEDEGNKKI